MALDQKQLFLFGHSLPGNEAFLLDRIKECADKRNKGIDAQFTSTAAIQQLPADVTQITVGHNYIAFLLKDFRIVRLEYDIIKNKVEPTIPIDTKGDTGPSGPSNTDGAASGNGNGTTSSDAAATAAAVAANAANRTAKIRRIMMARPGVRPGGFCRTGVIIDRNRSRPVIPVSSVPEDLIAQCQVVLQGKSREVIVRELQRTNLNVNEAVNNLLSRDDDEIDDLDETSEAYLHEELLSLLDAGLRSDTGGAAALLDNEIYSAGDGYEYLISRDLARRRGEDSKNKDAANKESDTGQSTQEQFVLGDTLVYWGGHSQDETDTQFNYPPGVKKFIKIASMHSELLALADNGKIYTWNWEKNAIPSKEAHSSTSNFHDERIVDMESCGLRTVAITHSGKVGSFMDSSCGQKLGERFVETAVEVSEGVDQLLCCSLFSAVLTKSGNILWRGIYPFNERRKLWEKVRSKRKQVTFDSSTEIVVGSEVRTKSTPIYSVGSIAVNFTQGLPMIGVLCEDAWTLNETCRFRVQTPETYDNMQPEKPSTQKEKRVSFNSSEGQPEGDSGGITINQSQSTATYTLTSKESAWNLKDVIFIHEEAINDTSIVKIVDGAYCGILNKSILEKAAETEATTDIIKGIRLMRKDDLCLVSSFCRGARCPENFQTQFKPLRLPSFVKRIISLAVDSTGFRILCERRSRVHLLRINCLGKMVSEYQMPINLDSLCQNDTANETNLPSINNFGDEGILMLRDSVGSFQPLIRNSIGGYKELAYTGLSRIYRFGMGMRYLKSSNEITTPTISTEQFTMDRKSKIGSNNKASNRILLMAALIAPNPKNTQPAIESLIQAVIFCNLQLVQEVLRKFDDIDIEQRKANICERIDGNRNIFHIVAMNASAKTNKDQADSEPSETSAQDAQQQKKDSSEAEATKARYDRKWNEMLGSSPTTRAKAQQAVKEAAAIKEPIEEKGTDPKRESTNQMEIGESSEEFAKKIPTSSKERQANSIEIIKELCKSPAVQEFFIELMQQRDVWGRTPFEEAIHSRAYSVALTLWTTVNDVRDWNQDFNDILLSKSPDGFNNDSALFILCANDTCSYTWTGEEHTTQDIYECKTCALVGTLCCCSECAYLCHRNHDCKLKRTSPTAYCDCWEKCDCKALVSGNNVKREKLFQLMLQNTKLIDTLNAKGEHFLLLLAKTVGRQMIEQESYVKRGKRPGPGQTTANGSRNPPEHNLEPPKFARRALDLALDNWNVVKSLIDVGVKKQPNDDVLIVENHFHLAEHNGSTHLDKFVFTLLASCEESSLDTLLNLMVRQANKQKQPNSEVHLLIQRFIRSVIRIFILVILLSPNAVGTLLAAITENISRALPDGTGVSPTFAPQTLSSSVQSSLTPQTTPSGSLRESLQNYRAVAISGMLSLVRASLPAALGLSTAGIDKKDQKKNKMIAFVAKCRRCFQTLLSYSINELIGAADCLIAPVRNGIVKPTGKIAANDDILDIIQEYLASEKDLSTIIKEIYNVNDDSIMKEGTGRIKKLMDMRQSERQQHGNMAANERASEDENSNDEDEEDEEIDGGPAASNFSRTRENSNASFVQRERTISEQSRRRQDTNNTVDMDENMEEEEDDDEENDEMDDDDEEENAYFDIHDDDEEDGEDSENSDDENQPENEGDSNDTATVTIGGAEVASTEGNENNMGDSLNARADDASSIAVSADLRRDNGNEIAVSQEPLTPVQTIQSGIRSRNVDGNGNASADNNNSRVTTANENSGGAFRETERTRESRSTVLRTSTSSGNTTAPAEPLRPSGQAQAAPPTTSAAEEDGSGNSTSNTSALLASCFSVIVKLIDELLLQLMLHSKWKHQLNRTKGITTLLDLDPKLFVTLKEILDKYYEPTWSWFYSVMDRTEAQLKYGHAITNSSIGPFINAIPIVAETGEEHREEQGESTRVKPLELQKKLKRRSDGTKRGESGEIVQESSSTRNEFFSYFLSLLRSAAAENGDDMPIFEINALKNIAFVAEAYLYHANFMDQLRQIELEDGINAKLTGFDEKESLMEVDTEHENEKKKKKLQRFYQRSNSISYPLLSTADRHHAFSYTATEALPLSAKSHLLNAEAERTQLFSLPDSFRSRSAHKKVAYDHGVRFPTHQSLSHPPLKYSELLEYQQQTGPRTPPSHSRTIAVQHYSGETVGESREENDEIEIILNSKLGLIPSALQTAIGRWSKTITLFTRSFHEELINYFGIDSLHSILLNKTGVCSFNVRLAQLRRQMDKLKSTQTKDLAFIQMPREKYSLLQQTFRQLNQHYIRRLSGHSATGTPIQQQQLAIASSSTGGEWKAPPLASHKVKVTFRDEPGEGTGVARHFYAAIAEALTTMKHLPSPDPNISEDGTGKPLDTKGTPGKSASTVEAAALANGGKSAKTPAGRASNQRGGSTEGNDRALPSGNLPPQISADIQPLFYRSAKTTGFLTVAITGSCTQQRLNAFRNVGRLIGICLQHIEIFPLPLCRHIFKFILGRPIVWFDLAFFDPSLFDSLRSIVYNEEKDEYHTQDFYQALEMTFSMDLPAEEGGGTLELKPGGAEIPVTRKNVLEYVYLFVEHRLLGKHVPCLEAIRRGVYDVIPAESLANLTAEDLRLILCGTQDVNIQLLQNFTKFLDESSASQDVLAKYKKTFWSVVNKFTLSEKQDLCFFWTGSPNLPSSEEGFQPLPTIMIRPADDAHLPTANTCISRLYVPLYSSKKILASKLQLAIKARNFGFV